MEFTCFKIVYSSLTSPGNPFQTLPSPAWGRIEHSLSFRPPPSCAVQSHSLLNFYLQVPSPSRPRVPWWNPHLTHLHVCGPLPQSRDPAGCMLNEKVSVYASPLQSISVSVVLVKYDISHNNQVIGVRWKWIWNSSWSFRPGTQLQAFSRLCEMGREAGKQ